MRVEDANQAAWEAYEPLEPFGYTEYQEETGFAENWQAALGSMISEDTMLSQYWNTADFRERNEQLRDILTGSGWSEEEMNRFRTRNGRDIDYNKLAMYVQETNPEAGIKTDEQLETEMVQELAMRREYTRDIQDRANWAGLAGAGVGTIQGVISDPLLAPTLVLGPTAAVGNVSFMRGIGYTAGKMGLYTATEEAAIQAQVYPWKQRIDSPYGIADVVTNIAGAGAGGAVLGAGAAAINRFFNGAELPPEAVADLKTWQETPDGQAATVALREIERELAEGPPGQTVQEFSDGMEAQYQSVTAPPKPDTTQALPNVMRETEDEVFASTLNRELDDQITNVADPEIDLVIPGIDETGQQVRIPLRQALQELDAEEQRLLQIEECLVG